MINGLRPRGSLTKLEEKDILLIVGIKNSEFTGHRDFWQNSQAKEESNKANRATGVALLCEWIGLLHTR